jgi:hypothetical protein
MWIINKITAETQEIGKVVTNINVTWKGSERNYSCDIGCEYDVDNFIQYDLLTEEKAIEWVESKLGEKHVKNIQKVCSEVPVVLETTEFPWEENA